MLPRRAIRTRTRASDGLMLAKRARNTVAACVARHVSSTIRAGAARQTPGLPFKWLVLASRAWPASVPIARAIHWLKAASCARFTKERTSQNFPSFQRAAASRSADFVKELFRPNATNFLHRAVVRREKSRLTIRERRVDAAVAAIPTASLLGRLTRRAHDARLLRHLVLVATDIADSTAGLASLVLKCPRGTIATHRRRRLRRCGLEVFAFST